ncbi:right-handed parallel beta-helix repeat-containing protein [Pyxidicoccus sp. QH1ED-7-1]|nr:right-handed parallel beta-helix repeat-containing protein [Pyxidicoccus xibeiensis]
MDAQGATVARVEVPNVTLARRRPGLLVLVPQPPPAGEPVGNAAPIVDAVVGSDAVVRPGAELALHAVARDPNAGEALTYAWRATGGSFSFADTTVDKPTWTAPVEGGAFTLTLQVTDARGAAATLDFGVDVLHGSSVDRASSAEFNRWPSLSELSAQPAKEVGVGSPVALQSASVDEDGDALTHAWTATCEGAFSDAAAPQASFTPSALPVAACDNCRLTLTVTDGFGGRREGTVELCVVRRLPPVIGATSQSSPGAGAAELVRLLATAEDPQGEPLTFTWTTNVGLLGPAGRTGNTGEVDWSALSCLPTDVVPEVQLTVTNASGLSDSHVFTVEWGGRRCGAHPPCLATLEDARVTLRADCTTESTIFIPDGYTFDGAGHVLTAVDAEGGHFQGAVLRNKGATAHVRDVTVSARGLSERVCDVGGDSLSGILLDGASGSILDSEVVDLHQKEGEGGCQEGTAISVRNAEDAEAVTQVEVRRNRVAGYQKVGILGSGRVDVTVEGNTVEGGGPKATIARNGIQLSYGATGRVTGNTVTGHSYTGPRFTASGILVAGGPLYDAPLCQGVVIRDNTLADNDVGINLSQAEADYGPPEPTRLEVVENTLSSAAVTNGYPYQAAISDLGGANVISRNRISGAGYDPATQPGITFDVDVVAEEATRVVFLTPSREVTAGACSGALVVQSQDALGNLSALAAPTLVLDAGGAEGVTFYGDAACTEKLAGSELVLEGAQREAVFYFQATQPGALTVTVTGDSISAQQAQTVR